MARSNDSERTIVDASPVKSFFVEMLIRDILLEEAILDLLDNCVDGILRSENHHTGTKPYQGYWAEIEFDKNHFEIRDNCGGIPWDLRKYAFRMGPPKDRPEEAVGTVGVYGIGMKRAIFKMGKSCTVSTQSGPDRYSIEIKPTWMDDPSDWQLPLEELKRGKDADGTSIYIGNLHKGIAQTFGARAESFTGVLDRMIATHYAFIIDKGFAVRINGRSVDPRPTRLVFDTRSGTRIRPFIFETTSNDVEVFLAVGFTRPIPSKSEADDEQEETRYSAIDAGWTVLCNDRAVLYCDRSELTGWGEANVPRYHNQFIAISGIVEFKSRYADRLPTTTTKRGIDASSPLYLQIKNKMREGMVIFIDYTNKWKGQAVDAKKHMDGARSMPLQAIKHEARNLTLQKTRRSFPEGRQYRPQLPMPVREQSTQRRISFTKELNDIQKVSEYLFREDDRQPSVVGEACFDAYLKRASQ